MRCCDLKSCNLDNATLSKSRNYDDVIHCEVVSAVKEIGEI